MDIEVNINLHGNKKKKKQKILNLIQYKNTMFIFLIFKSKLIAVLLSNQIFYNVSYQQIFALSKFFSIRLESFLPSFYLCPNF